MNSQEKFGIICSSFKESDLKLLRERKISYCIPESELKIFSSHHNQSKNESLAKGDDLYTINPTKIVSPSGLEIVDTIFKLDENEIQCTPANISQLYNLSRSKLSTIMTVFKVKKIFDLKERLLDLPTSWWLRSFDNPITKRKMTPFKTVETRKYIFKGSIDVLKFQDKILNLKKQSLEVEIGGISYLKYLGALKTPEFDLLVRDDQMIDVVEILSLRPAKRGEVENLVLMTPLIGDIKSEKLIVKKRNYNMKNLQRKFSENLTDVFEDVNVLRYLWGLNYDEERVREERKRILEDYLNEVRKGHN